MINKTTNTYVIEITLEYHKQSESYTIEDHTVLKSSNIFDDLPWLNKELQQ